MEHNMGWIHRVQNLVDKWLPKPNNRILRKI